MNSIEQTVAAIPRHGSETIRQAVEARWDSLTKPRGSLGRLEQAVVKLALVQGNAMPQIERQGLYIFCGDHGIVEEGVSAYPSVVTREMMKNFVSGGAAINVICRQYKIETAIVDCGVGGPKLPDVLDLRIAEGANNFLHSLAMPLEQAAQAISQGIDLASDASVKFDLVGVGEMGIGNSTSASALLCAFTGISAEEAAGRGAGLDDAALLHKIKVISAALTFHQLDNKSEPLNIVAAFAGFEIATMAGFILGAAARNLPVVIDGFISSAAFLIAHAFCPHIGDRVLFGHRSAERGHTAMLHAVSAHPLLDFEMRLGEGTGAALAMNILSTAVHLYRDMATFAEASVSDASNIKKGTQTA